MTYNYSDYSYEELEELYSLLECQGKQTSGVLAEMKKRKEKENIVIFNSPSFWTKQSYTTAECAFVRNAVHNFFHNPPDSEIIITLSPLGDERQTIKITPSGFLMHMYLYDLDGLDKAGRHCAENNLINMCDTLREVKAFLSRYYEQKLGTHENDAAKFVLTALANMSWSPKAMDKGSIGMPTIVYIEGIKEDDI